jgi:hypothetical protein
MKKMKYIHIRLLIIILVIIIVCTLPTSGLETGTNATVTNTSETSVTGTKVYTADITGEAPTVSLIYPTSGFNTTNNVINIIGTNFRTNAYVSLNRGVTNHSATIINLTNTIIISRLPTYGLIKGGYNISVTNSDGSSGTIYNTYGLNAPKIDPTITSVYPTSSNNLTNHNVTVTGTNFRNCFVIAMKKGTNLYACTTINYTTTNATCTLPTRGLTTGIYDIVLRNLDGTNATKNSAYTII